jgi:hypothetical protein
VRRPLTWVSGAMLAVIFLALSALVTRTPAPPAATVAAFQAVSTPAPPHQAAPRTDQYTRPAVHMVSLATTYTARRGDTLSSIARAWLGHADRWPALWWANKRAVRNPDALRTGTQLSLAVPAHPVHAWLAAKALAAIPKPPAPKPVAAQLASSTSGSPGGTSATPAASAAVSPAGGFEACVIQHESGGNADAQNPTSTASGLYGFLSTTWTAVTGLPGPARDYSPAQQQAAFDKLYAQSGTSPWAAYDGC